MRVLPGREMRSRKAVHVLQGFPSLSRIILGGFLSRGGGLPLPFSTESAWKGRISDILFSRHGGDIGRRSRKFRKFPTMDRRSLETVTQQA